MKRLTAVLLSVFLLAVSVLAASGDVNGDDELNNKDVVSLFRYVSGDKNAVEDESACDINGDGGIDNKDVVSLFRNVSSGAVPSETDEQRETETEAEEETEKEISEEVEEETEIEISEEVEETSERVTQTDKETEKEEEFRSVQPSHETPDFIENPTTMHHATPYGFPLGSHARADECQYIVFEIFDCGYEQFEKFKAFQGQALPEDTYF